ncbi:MAG: dephospho-CoA kinase [Porticoccaceae bacterium]|nr:MAG: dephospho-CoA kinase [SAR92 bacterium MED-G29]
MENRRLILGLTGGIGTGKSSVAAEFKNLGICIVNADEGSRAVVEPGKPALSKIASQFGDQIILSDGSLDRAALREIIFNNANKKQWLEELLHPIIRDWIVEHLNDSDSPYVILESPLLLETDQHELVDITLLIDLPMELQLERAGARDANNSKQIQRIIDSQMSREQKISKADWIFDNSGEKAMISYRVNQLHEKFLALAQSIQTQNLL